MCVCVCVLIAIAASHCEMFNPRYAPFFFCHSSVHSPGRRQCAGEREIAEQQFYNRPTVFCCYTQERCSLARSCPPSEENGFRGICDLWFHRFHLRRVLISSIAVAVVQPPPLLVLLLLSLLHSSLLLSLPVLLRQLLLLLKLSLLLLLLLLLRAPKVPLSSALCSKVAVVVASEGGRSILLIR